MYIASYLNLIQKREPNDLFNIHPIRSKYNIYNIRKYFPHSRSGWIIFWSFLLCTTSRNGPKDKNLKRRRAGVFRKSWTKKNEIRKYFPIVWFFLIPVCRHHFVHAHITRPSYKDQQLMMILVIVWIAVLYNRGKISEKFRYSLYIRTSFALYFGSFKICLHFDNGRNERMEWIYWKKD